MKLNPIMKKFLSKAEYRTYEKLHKKIDNGNGKFTAKEYNKAHSLARKANMKAFKEEFK